MKRTPLRRRTPMRCRNPERVRESYARNYGERGEAVREMRCLVAASGGCTYETQAAHAHARGMGGRGGDRRSLVPLCSGHHAEQGRIGVKSFMFKFHVDLFAEADRIAGELDTRGIP